MRASTTLRPGRVLGELAEPVRRGALRRPGALLAYLRGRWLRSRDRPGEAARALARADRGQPGNPVYGLYLAVALREAGATGEARERLRSLLAAVGSDDAWSIAHAAQLLVSLGEIPEGRRLAERAAAAAPEGSPAQGAAALAVEHAGEPSRALELARRAKDADQQQRLTGLLRALDPGWFPAVRRSSAQAEMGGESGDAERRALCLLEASLPQAASGYAYRSRDLLAALRAAGFDPVAATRLGFPAGRGVAEPPPVEQVDGVAHHRFNLPGRRHYSGIPLDRQLELNAEGLLELAGRIRPALVIAATPSLNAALGLALRAATGAPLVYDVRGFPEMTWAAQAGGADSELYRLRRGAETGRAEAADAVITLSETMRAELAARGLPGERISVVPQIVDTDRFSPRPRDEGLARSLGLEGSFTVGSVSSLTDYEGLDELLRAVALARAEGVNAGALIVGDGPARPTLEALAAELEIAERVSFTGRIERERVPEHYALLDLFAVPRRDLEVCRAVTPLKPFEALAMGVPLLASDLPALAEIVSASSGGRLVPAGSPGALAEAIVELAGDPPALERLAASGRDHVVADHAPGAAQRALRSAVEPLFR